MISSLMPLYDDVCYLCGSTFEKLRRMSDDDRDVRCPDCSSSPGHVPAPALLEFSPTSAKQPSRASRLAKPTEVFKHADEIRSRYENEKSVLVLCPGNT